MTESTKTKLNHLSKSEIINVVLTLITYVCGMGIFFYMEHHLFDAEGLAHSMHLPVEEVEAGIGGMCFAIVTLVMAIVFAIINRELLKKQWESMKHHKKEVMIWAVIGAVLVYAIMTLNHHSFHGPHHSYTVVSNQLAGIFGPVLLVAMCVGMAFVEEVSYKVCCFLPVEGLELKKASLVAAVLYGLLNGVIFFIFSPHYAVGAFLMYTLLGLKFGLLYYHTHTIFTSIFAGSIYSTLMIILTFLA